MLQLLPLAHAGYSLIVKRHVDNSIFESNGNYDRKVGDSQCGKQEQFYHSTLTLRIKWAT